MGLHRPTRIPKIRSSTRTVAGWWFTCRSVLTRPTLRAARSLTCRIRSEPLFGTQAQYDNPDDLMFLGAYDVSSPSKEISYSLVPLENTTLAAFEGRWGYLDKDDLDSSANGPPGPPNRTANDTGGGKVNLRDSPKDLHNKARKTSQAAKC